MNVQILENYERLEKLEEIILELQELARNGAIIVVEGRKDADSLRLLGINGDFMLSSQRPLLEFTEKLSRKGKMIILLTDWDTRGGLMARKIMQHLQYYGIVPDMEIRGRIGVLVKKRIKDIESLNNYIRRLRMELYGAENVSKKIWPNCPDFPYAGSSRQ